MRYGIQLLAGIMLFLPMVSLAADNNCVTCHAEWEEGDKAPSKLWTADIHKEAGLSCNDCHGGDPALDDMDMVRKSAGYVGIPKTGEIPKFCARCHSSPEYMKKFNPALPVDQLEKYQTSIHGKKLLSGDTKAANCVSCHSVHNIAPAKIPTSTVYPLNLPKTCAHCHADSAYMASYGIPTDQYSKFASSVHGQALLEREDLGAPACNDCHGNHGATPPGVENIAAVCGMCHATHATLFASSPHKPAFEASNMPQCETCHSNHAIVKPLDAMVGTGPQSLCADCHSQGDKGFETAAAVSVLLDSLVRTENQAVEIIADADQKGMAVDDELFALKDVHTTLVDSRTKVHAFNLAKVQPDMEKGIMLASATHQAGLKIIDEYYFRRKGLGIATIIITILAVLIWLKIREVEKP